MPGFLKEHLRPLAGSAGLHLGLLALLGFAALRWTSSQPPVELAIEGYVVAEPVPARPAARPRSEPPAVEVAQPPEPVAEPPQERRAEEAEAAERAAQAEREREQAAQRAAAEREARVRQEQLAREQAAAEQRRAEEAERREAEAAEAKRKAEAQALAERESRARAERETDLKRALAAEEEEAALARSGAMDEYRALLVQAIERNWIRPPSARAGLKCTLDVTQAPGGTVTDVRLGACNGDEAVRESITNAVYRASPLPAPRDPRAFARRLEIVFTPRE